MDISLYYAERGEGQPLVLLHGNGESHRYFAGQIDFFAASRRVIAVDTRGHGASPRGTAPFTIAQFALDLEEFLDGLGLEQVDLLGFSDGGNIALTFALAHPERLRRLVLNGANLDPGGVKRTVQFPIELGYRAARRAAKRDPRAVRNMELLGLMVNHPHIEPAALRTLEVPTLVIAGTRDLIQAEHTRLIAGSLPQGELVFIRGNHFIAAKNPDVFNAAVDEFLRRD
ncbi:MAG: alpha/beta fold hydrolase [Oscillospiraceae bacterium]|nr:alpha/beta fold hydrolase [Oscillospiraceae bacterium]